MMKNCDKVPDLSQTRTLEEEGRKQGQPRRVMAIERAMKINESTVELWRISIYPHCNEYSFINMATQRAISGGI